MENERKEGQEVKGPWVSCSRVLGDKRPLLVYVLII